MGIGHQRQVEANTLNSFCRLKRRIGQLTNVGSGRFLLSDAVGRCDAVAKHLRGQDVAPVRGAETCSDSGPWVPLRPLELTGPGHTNRLVPDPQSVSRWETFSKRSWGKHSYGKITSALDSYCCSPNSVDDFFHL